MHTTRLAVVRRCVFAGDAELEDDLGSIGDWRREAVQDGLPVAVAVKEELSMLRPSRSCLRVQVMAAWLLGLAPGIVFAQATTGGIVGKVTDSSKAVLPGSTVTVASPSLIRGTQTLATDADGTYRFQNLPPGPYAVTAELAGFDAVKRDAIVEAGRTIAIDFELSVGTLKETLTVSGQAPLVDVQNTRTGTTVDQSLIQNIPTGRSFSDILNIQPGVNESTYTFAPVN